MSVEQTFRWDLARCKPEALTDAFLEMVAAGYEAVHSGRWYAEDAFYQAWERWKSEEIDDCNDCCDYGGCGGYPPQCGGCCQCIGGCQVQMENSWVASSMRLDHQPDWV